MSSLHIGIAWNDGDDPVTVERLHKRLRTYLEDSGAGEVNPVRTHSTTPGSRGGGEIAFGVLELVLSSATGAIITALTNSIIEYVKRSDRTVWVKSGDTEIQIDRATAAEARELLQRAASTFPKEDT